MINLIKRFTEKREERKRQEELRAQEEQEKRRLEQEQIKKQLEERRIKVLSTELPDKQFIARLHCGKYPAEHNGERFTYLKYDYFLLPIPAWDLGYRESCKAIQLTGDHVGESYTITNWSPYCTIFHIYLYDSNGNYYEGRNTNTTFISSGIKTVAELNDYTNQENLKALNKRFEELVQIKRNKNTFNNLLN